MKESKKGSCNLLDPSTWKVDKFGILRHIAPECTLKHKSCFFSKAEAVAYSLATCISGVNISPGGNGKNEEIRRFKCFSPVIVGIDGITLAPRECVTCVLRLRGCSYHGWPSARQGELE